MLYFSKKEALQTSSNSSTSERCWPNGSAACCFLAQKREKEMKETSTGCASSLMSFCFFSPAVGNVNGSLAQSEKRHIQCQDWRMSENEMEPMSPYEGFQVEWGEAGPLGQILAGKPRPYVTQHREHSVLLSLRLRWVKLLIMRERNSWFKLCSGIRPTLPWLRTWVLSPARVASLARSSSSSSWRAKTDGEKNKDSVCRDWLYFIFLMSNWLSFPALVVFSVI